jgi:hypothetical protein
MATNYKDSSAFIEFLKGTPYREVIRKQFYSYVNYPLAGSSTLNFFGDALSSTVNAQLTNMPKANSFADSYFLVKSLRTSWFINNSELSSFNGTDAETVASDWIAGFPQAGYLDFSIGSRTFLQIPKPFLFASGSHDSDDVTSGTSATSPALGDNKPFAMGRACSQFLIDPAIAIEPDANFSISINYPTGVVPVIATGIVTAAAGVNPLYVGIELDGIWARKLQ